MKYRSNGGPVWPVLLIWTILAYLGLGIPAAGVFAVMYFGYKAAGSIDATEHPTLAGTVMLATWILALSIIVGAM